VKRRSPLSPRRRTRRLACLGLFASAGFLFAADPIRADDGQTPTPSAAGKNEARARFDRGVHLFEKGETASALAEFKRANELVPNPLVLYNMGLVYAAMSRPVDAVDSLDAYLAQATGPQRAQRHHAEEVRAEQATRIAKLVVKTSAPASIDVDGIQVGQTPLTTPIRVASGAHIVGAQAPGYLATRREITLPGEATQTIEIQLQAAAARLAQLWISSSPQGAEILVNGKSVGTTPLSASISVDPGELQVEARRAGYLRAARILSLGDGARGDVAFALEEDVTASPSSRSLLRVVASEPGVEIAVDGIVRPNAGSGVSLPQGRHQLRVTLAGFETVDRAVDLPPGNETPLAVILVPTAQTRERYEASVHTRKVVGWSVLGAGAVLAIGGAVYAFTRFKDVSDSRSYLNQVLANENDASNTCYINQGPTYQLRGCDAIKADAQNRVDSAVLKRNLGFVGAGVGVLAAGVGGYLLLSASDPKRYRREAEAEGTHAAFWLGDGIVGVTLASRF